jgi:hypothetical protein
LQNVPRFLQSPLSYPENFTETAQRLFNCGFGYARQYSTSGQMAGLWSTAPDDTRRHNHADLQHHGYLPLEA